MPGEQQEETSFAQERIGCPGMELVWLAWYTSMAQALQGWQVNADTDRHGMLSGRNLVQELCSSLLLGSFGFQTGWGSEGQSRLEHWPCPWQPSSPGIPGKGSCLHLVVC